MKLVKPLNLFNELLKKNPSKRGRFLGLCINEQHVDLAVSDPDNLYAVPLSVIHRHEGSMDLMADKFQTLISEHNLAGFVIDSPYRTNSTRCDSGAIKNFIFDLLITRKFPGLKYTFWSDQIATKHMDFVVEHNVKFILEDLNLSQLDPKEIVDKFAAARLLQGYLDCVHTSVELDKKADFHK
ncbi:hypothetical protein Dsin_024014 [Dipteronia sinensis]|uniref:YqgF/RNase H-like domain-containing protein n=1 Tax=Dipteronia sinensis TaxID=43782 RepID=A0AAE0A4N9_9ROSI|nr:hypothetical protein Dsin_024014 [Dipteronia sinensis]